MAKQPKGASQEAPKVWTNVSKHIVLLSDGSQVHPGERTAPEQADLVPGSLWEEHGVLSEGIIRMSVEDSELVKELQAENEVLRQELFDAHQESEQLKEDAERFSQEIARLTEELQALKKGK